MRLSLMILVAATSIVAAQQPDELPRASEHPGEQDVYDAEAWLRVSFEDRERRFAQEARDSEWAPTMEVAIREAVADLDRPLTELFPVEVCSRLPICQEEMPPVQLENVECRRTLCKIEMLWPTGTFRGIVGQQVSLLYGLGIDHQGETNSRDDGNRYSVELIARRRTQ